MNIKKEIMGMALIALLGNANTSCAAEASSSEDIYIERLDGIITGNRDYIYWVGKVPQEDVSRFFQLLRRISTHIRVKDDKEFTSAFSPIFEMVPRGIEKMEEAAEIAMEVTEDQYFFGDAMQSVAISLRKGKTREQAIEEARELIS